jgi:transglutaminase-like putative cysteine protease
MIYQVTHTTIYNYTEPVSLCHNLVHLKPRVEPLQTTRDFHLTVEPAPAVFTDGLDYFGNCISHFTLQEPHRRLTLTASHRTEVIAATPPESARTPSWEEVIQMLNNNRDISTLDALQYTYASPYIPLLDELQEYARPSFKSQRPILEAVIDLTHRIHTEFKYDPTATTLATPVEEVLRKRRGVCQDFAQLEIGCLRSLGLAARYHSGYLLTQPPPGQPRLVGTDASHAWLSVFIPGFDWVAIDPTNDVIPSDQHILLARGRDYDDVSPIKGIIIGGGRHTVSVSVDVRPV